jgi:hypothetical protein
MKSKSTEEGRYSKVSRRMWVDEKFQSLSKPAPSAQFLWQRLLTGPELGCIPGLFSARLGGIADALDWSKEDTQRCWNEISEQDMAEADWAMGLVWIPNAISHNEPASPNAVTGWRLALCELPECDLKRKAIETIREYLTEMGEVWIKAFDSMKATGKASPKASGNQDSGNKKQDTGEGARTKKPEIEIPDDWKPTEEHVERAKKTGLNLSRETDKFTAYAKSKAVVAVNWNAKFTTWLINAEGFLKKDGGFNSYQPNNRASPGQSALIDNGNSYQIK